ncbi:capZ-interacting protein isoform X2 [Chrysemys picta bellii]|uniref:capZ-interacting protein isoform X2 n=1 Tax=Chrysemys picta bellii TaxID=8478 RepID=UPI0032B17128
MAFSLPPLCWRLVAQRNMKVTNKGRPAETKPEVEKSASLSVAQLAGKFKEQAASVSGKEVPANKPTRRKPPCSLPLHTQKVELGHNGETKPSPNACPLPRVKVKSSPLIEKLQANLAFAPAALVPGTSPKSPGLKVIPSPFSTPPSTPSSPGIQSRSSESDETPVSFDQPPEGTHLKFYNKVRTRGSLKRRPPSRKFRKSQSDSGDGEDLRATGSSQENGAKEEDGDEVFMPKSQKEELQSPVYGTGSKLMQKRIGSNEKPPSGRGSSSTENKEEREKETEAAKPCKSSTGDKEKPCASTPGEEERKSSQSTPEEKPCPSTMGDKDKKLCQNTPGDKEGSTLGEREDGSASEQEKRNKENKEVMKEENSEGKDIQETSDTQEKSLETGMPQPAADTGTASEHHSVMPMQEPGTVVQNGCTG